LNEAAQLGIESSSNDVGTLNAAIARDRSTRTTDYQQARCLMYGFLIRSGTHLERMLNRKDPPLQLPEIVGL
jgi:hypothetical protein